MAFIYPPQLRLDLRSLQPTFETSEVLSKKARPPNPDKVGGLVKIKSLPSAGIIQVRFKGSRHLANGRQLVYLPPVSLGLFSAWLTRLPQPFFGCKSFSFMRNCSTEKS